MDINNSIMIGNDFISDIACANAVDLDSLYINSNLSPEIASKLKSTYNIMDDKIKSLIIK